MTATPQKQAYQLQISWISVLSFSYVHYAACVGLYYTFTTVSWSTLLWTAVLGFLSTQGTAGAHRMYCHRCYKAKLPLRVLLLTCQTLALQKNLYQWCQDHRIHHKYVDTDGDPHNCKRGFFYSHMGWLLVEEHPEALEKARTIDMSDLQADPMVMFQKKYYYGLAPLFAFFLPAVVPWYFWGEDFYVAYCVAGMLRYALTLHAVWFVNSAAHFYGTKPYDRNIRATENLFVAVVSNGEGWHNYHHTFPWDYKAEELGQYGTNFSTAFIDLMATIGLAYDLKSVSPELIKKRMARTGSASNDDGLKTQEPAVWGWDDKDMLQEDKKLAIITK